MLAAAMTVISLPLGALSLSALAPRSAMSGLQALQTDAFVYGAFTGTGIALDLFFIAGLAALYFVLRNISQVGALAGVLFGLIGFGLYLATELPLRYVQIAASREYAAATSDVQRSGIIAAYQLAFDYANITTLMATFLLALMFLFTGFAMLREKRLFGPLVSYFAFVAGLLALVSVSLFAVPLVFGFLFQAYVLAGAIFSVLAGRRLYRM